MKDQNLAQMLGDRGSREPHAVAFRVRRGDGYVDIPWSQVTERMAAMAAGILSAGALDDGACISIIGNTSMSTCLVDFAALSVGLKTVPIYASLLPAEVGYMHVDTATRLIVVEDAGQLAKVRALRGGFRFAEQDYAPESLMVRAKIVVVDPSGLDRADDWESLESLEARGRESRQQFEPEMRRRQARISREDVATFTYTSGTTGPPKAVIQTHENVLAMLEDVADAGLVDETVLTHGLFLFLPAAHSFGRMIQFAGPFFGSPLVLSSVPTLAADLVASRPGFFPAAPRVFEKMKANIQATVATRRGVPGSILRWALGVGARIAACKVSARIPHRLLELMGWWADRLVLARIRRQLGLDRASVLLSGAAPLRPDVQLFFLALGLTIQEAYGLTETCPGLTVNRKDGIRPGTVGQAFRRCELKVAADGELLARGPNVTRGYLNRPEATAEAFDDQGWFHTGDLASMDPEGFVRITGRKKELIKTSGGKYVAPLKIEALLKQHPLVQEAVVIGEGRNYCTALLALDAEWVRTFSSQALLHEKLQALVEEANSDLAPFERIKKFGVAPSVFSVDGGELTASLKVKRHAVVEKYNQLIEAMY